MEPQPATERGPSPPARGWARAGAWMLVLAAVAALFQLLARNPYDADTAYHVAVARLMRADGILRAFPWTPFSWLSDHYADKDFLFHVLLLPLTSLEWSTAARIAGAVCGAAALGALYAVLRAERVERAELWSLLPLAASGAFAFRFALVRPHLLAIALSLAVAWAASRRRLAVLAAAAFLYPLAYVGWPMALGIAVLAELARLLSGQRPSLRTPAVAAAALAAGLLAHPNFPDIARFAWIVNAEILLQTAWSARQGFDLGREFDPFSAGEAVRFLLLPAILVAGAWVLAWRRRRLDPVALAFTLCATAFLAVALRTARFVEYAVPFAACAAALASSGARLPRLAPAAVLAGAFAFTAAFGRAGVVSLAARGDDVPPPFAELFRRVVPSGAQVFTCEWGLTGRLLLAMPGRRFLVALDPFLFWRKDPDRHAAWRRLVHEGGAGAAGEIRSTFGARFVLCTADPRNAPLLRALTADAGVSRVLRSPLWFLYDLEAPAAPGGAAVAR